MLNPCAVNRANGNYSPLKVNNNLTLSASIQPFHVHTAMPIGAKRMGGPLHESASNYHIISPVKSKAFTVDVSNKNKTSCTVNINNSALAPRQKTTYQDWANKGVKMSNSYSKQVAPRRNDSHSELNQTQLRSLPTQTGTIDVRADLRNIFGDSTQPRHPSQTVGQSLNSHHHSDIIGQLQKADKFFKKG